MITLYLTSEEHLSFFDKIDITTIALCITAALCNEINTPPSPLRILAATSGLLQTISALPQYSPLSAMDQTTDDRLVDLQRQIRSWRPLHPVYSYISLLFLAVGAICSYIRYHNGWSYEEAGVWINLGFWGGYIGGAAISVFINMWGRRISREMENNMQEFEREQAKRAL